MPPAEIICLVNGNHFHPEETEALRQHGCHIVQSDINSLYNRWALSYLCRGDYVCIFDDDTIPGNGYVEHAIKCCEGYNSIAGARGRLYDPAGLHEYFKVVVPRALDADSVSCGGEDILCDWVCNSYLFKREWVHGLLAEDACMNSFATHDDLQVAMSALRSLGVGCVVPRQPPDRPELAGSLHPEYGDDHHAVWIAHRDTHFAVRRDYLQEALRERNFVPTRDRNRTKFHVVIPFCSRRDFAWCLRSAVAQTYGNYQLYLIDACADEKVQETLDILVDLGVPAEKVVLAKTLWRVDRASTASQLAYELLKANHSDVVVQLRDLDRLTRPDALQLLAKMYACPETAAVGGGIASDAARADADPSSNESEAGSHLDTRQTYRQSGRLSSQSEPALLRGQTDGLDSKGGTLRDDLILAHQRVWSHRYHLGELGNELELSKSTRDSASMSSILQSEQASRIRELPQTLIAGKQSRQLVGHAERPAQIGGPYVPPYSLLNYGGSSARESWRVDSSEARHASTLFDDAGYAASYFPPHRDASRMAVFTIVTPDHVADGLLAVESMRDAGHIYATPIVFVTGDTNQLDEGASHIACALGIELRLASEVAGNDPKDMCEQLAAAYAVDSDQFRWSMKSVLAADLLLSGYPQVVFTDPDTLTVSSMADVLARSAKHGFYLFPHFLHYDCEQSRRTLYLDGFYNGGLFSCTTSGLRVLSKWFQRCLQRMDKSFEDHTYVDQKYLDTITYEDASVGHNHDRGVNFNIWNTERVQCVFPSLKSYLLECGRFVRHWHFTRGMINACLHDHENTTVFYPAIIRYLALRIALLTTLRAACRAPESRKALDLRLQENADTLQAMADKLPAEHRWRALAKLRETSFAFGNTDSFMRIFVDEGLLLEHCDFLKRLASAASSMPQN